MLLYANNEQQVGLDTHIMIDNNSQKPYVTQIDEIPISVA